MATLKMGGLMIMLLCVFCTNCKKETEEEQLADSFTITSPAIGDDGLLPAKYTCDGLGISPPVQWSGFPDGTRYFALIMHHEASPDDIHWYWVLYNIPASVVSMPENHTGTGISGNNSVNGQTAYAPPCSQGPGAKEYTITVYALSDFLITSYPPEEVTRAILLDEIKDITLASASLSFEYTRQMKQSPCKEF